MIDERASSEPVTVSLHILHAYLAGRVPLDLLSGADDQANNPFFHRARDNFQISSVEIKIHDDGMGTATFHFEPDKRT